MMRDANWTAGPRSWAFLCVPMLASCVGTLEPGGGGLTPMPDMTTPPGAGGSGMGPAMMPGPCQAPEPGPSPLRRLTRREYNNTVRDLLGDTTRPAEAFPAEEDTNGFGNDAAAQRSSGLLAEGYFDAAKSLAAQAVADTNALAL